jgi:hypothetical protein
VSRTTPFYRYDPKLGDPRAEYSRADVVHPAAGQPELPGVFVAKVEGETIINTMNGRQPVAWQAAPGTQCIILGYWSDGTVHLKWAAINNTYRIDGRFPSWVAEVDPNATMAGGGRVLRANSPPVLAPGVSSRLVLLAVLVVVGLLLLAFPPVREALGALVHASR